MARNAKPLFIRVCIEFVDNLTLILKTTFVLGSIVLVQDLLQLMKETGDPVVYEEITVTVPEKFEASGEPEAPGSVMTDGVILALNCTYEDYRNTHFDECVKEGSGIYQRPQAEPDDTGYIFYDSRVLFAKLDDAGSFREATENSL